jgi:hypothetical protein
MSGATSTAPVSPGAEERISKADCKDQSGGVCREPEEAVFKLRRRNSF